MKIVILSKFDFEERMKMFGITNENVEDKNDTFFISIHYNGVKDPYFENRENVKVLYFDDCLVKDQYNTPINEDQAMELLDFIDLHKDKKYCMIHCAAGISRSGAVGTFICDYTDSNFNLFIQDNPQIHPNVLVLNLLKKAVMKKHNLRMY